MEDLSGRGLRRELRTVWGWEPAFSGKFRYSFPILGSLVFVSSEGWLSKSICLNFQWGCTHVEHEALDLMGVMIFHQEDPCPV
jgi:hypothetical protein